MARLEFELAYNDFAVLYVMETPPHKNTSKNGDRMEYPSGITVIIKWTGRAKFLLFTFILMILGKAWTPPLPVFTT